MAAPANVVRPAGVIVMPGGNPVRVAAREAELDGDELADMLAQLDIAATPGIKERAQTVLRMALEALGYVPGVDPDTVDRAGLIRELTGLVQAQVDVLQAAATIAAADMPASAPANAEVDTSVSSSEALPPPSSTPPPPPEDTAPGVEVSPAANAGMLPALQKRVVEVAAAQKQLAQAVAPAPLGGPPGVARAAASAVVGSATAAAEAAGRGLAAVGGAVEAALQPPEQEAVEQLASYARRTFGSTEEMNLSDISAYAGLSAGTAALRQETVNHIADSIDERLATVEKLRSITTDQGPTPVNAARLARFVATAQLYAHAIRSSSDDNRVIRARAGLAVVDHLMHAFPPGANVSAVVIQPPPLAPDATPRTATLEQNVAAILRMLDPRIVLGGGPRKWYTSRGHIASILASLTDIPVDGDYAVALPRLAYSAFVGEPTAPMWLGVPAYPERIDEAAIKEAMETMGYAGVVLKIASK